MDSRQKIIIFILMLGTLMGSLDSTIVILAFPSISTGLHADLLTTLWIILIYLLVVAVCTTQLGRLGDIYGRGKMFNTGFGIFTIGSLFCGLSPSVSLLIFSRAIQAFGGALMQANSGAIVADAFPPNVRGAAFGYISLGWTSGAMLGIVLGGVITTFVGWEYCFFINIPIGIIATFLGYRYVRDNVRTNAVLDIPGMLLLGTALTLIAYGSVDFAGQGLTGFNIAVSVIGILTGLLFIAWEFRTTAPIIDFVSLSSRILKFSLLAAFFLSLGYLAVVFLITMYLQGVRSLSPLDAALLLMPGYIAGSLLSPFMGKMADRYGARIIATFGATVLIVATLIFLTLGTSTPFWVVLLASGVSGIGSAMFFPANNSAVMAYARPGSYGGISGVLRTIQNIGILGSFVIAISVASASIPREEAFQIFIGTASLNGTIADAFIHGIDAALLFSVAVMALAVAFSWMRGHEDRDRVGPDAPEGSGT